MSKTSLLVAATAMAVCISACGDGGSSPAKDSLTDAPPPLPGVEPGTAKVATQAVFLNLTFESPVALLQAPGDDSRWFTVEQEGRVLMFDNDPGASTAQVFLDIRDQVRSGGEMGLLGMTFHPDFPSNAEVFLSFTRPNPQPGDPTISHVSQFLLAPNGETLDPASEQIVLTVPQDFNNHNGGNIAFGPDGYLYIGLGDGGSGNDPLNRGQDTTNLLGAMLRIDVDVDGGSPYAIPEGNPFHGNRICSQGFGNADCPEIYAWGLRNPWRWSFDRQTGELWVGDVGQATWEEVDVLESGGNYGWRDREGAHCNPNLYPDDNCPTSGLIDPVAEYDHGIGRSITGGYVYRGNAIAGLVGVYVYGDFGSGRIFQYHQDAQGNAISKELLDTDFSISSFAEANDGEIYLLDYASGSIHQIVEAP